MPETPDHGVDQSRILGRCVFANNSHNARHKMSTVEKTQPFPAGRNFGGQGKDSNLRYDLRRIAALAGYCLKPLSHLS